MNFLYFAGFILGLVFVGVESSASPSRTPSVVPSCKPTVEPSVRPTNKPVTIAPTYSMIPTYSPVIPAVSYSIYAYAGTSDTATSTGDGGQASSCTFNVPYGVFQNTLGAMFVAEYTSNRIRIISKEGIVSLFGGGSSASNSGDGGSVSSATFNNPTDVWCNSLGTLYILTKTGNTLRVVDSNLIINAFVGTGSTGSSGDNGVASNALISGPFGMVGDSIGNIYLSDTGNNKIRKITNNIITMLVGTGSQSQGADGLAATSTGLYSPFDVFLDTANNLYLSDQLNYVVRRVQYSTKITRIVAGVLALISYTGDGLTATSSHLNSPLGVWQDLSGNLFIFEWQFYRVKYIPSSQLIYTIAGLGTSVASGNDGPASSAGIRSCYFIWGNTLGTIYLSDNTDKTIRQLMLTPFTDTSTMSPTLIPTIMPVVIPSTQPSCEPTIVPSCNPTLKPSELPSLLPSVLPSFNPTFAPSQLPSYSPSVSPSDSPSQEPSFAPTIAPSVLPSILPSQIPTIVPSISPSICPTVTPSTAPTVSPSSAPSVCPSAQPSVDPSICPSIGPSETPSVRPSLAPTCAPSVSPSIIPTIQPSCEPILQPTIQPSKTPSHNPTVKPSVGPTFSPTLCPTELPTVIPSLTPPSVCPSHSPTIVPSIMPTAAPSNYPTIIPTQDPSLVPTVTPSRSPTCPPTAVPTIIPSLVPSIEPSFSPTTQRPTVSPSTVEYYNTHPKATLPNNKSISVIGHRDQSFRVVLSVFAISSKSNDDVFIDIVLSDGTGIASVVSGSDSLISASLEDTEITSFSGFIAFDSVHRSVSVVPDFNGDGYDDLIIGDPYASSKCYVLFGKSDGLIGLSQGFTIFGDSQNDRTGWSVSGAGDVNNDTFQDIIIGAPFAKGVGAVYVIYGKRENVDVYLTNLTSSEGFVLYGANYGDFLGISVSTAGDVNKDGCDDFIVGAVMTFAFNSGAAYIVFGCQNVSSSSISGEHSVKLSGSAYLYAAYTVSAAGDINQDGYDDVLIGTSPTKATIPPSTFVIFGNKTMKGTIQLNSLQIGEGVRIVGGGNVIASLGDINQDNFDDVLIGSGISASVTTGMIVYSNINFMTENSKVPTVSPTEVLVPTFKPSRQPSVRPSLKPTKVPSTPQPSALSLSASPSSFSLSGSPSLEPSMEPSERMTDKPTIEPSEAPTVSPTNSPSELPSVIPTLSPSTLSPSGKPIEIPPTRQPFTFPTLLPTFMMTDPAVPSVVEYVVNGHSVLYNDSTSTLNTVYIVNTTSDVTIIPSVGACIYQIIPGESVVLVIEKFNKSIDKVDVSLFTQILQYSDLLITAGSVIVTLPSGQIVHIMNLQPEDIMEKNFIINSNTSKTNNNIIDVILNVLMYALPIFGGLLIGLWIWKQFVNISGKTTTDEKVFVFSYHLTYSYSRDPVSDDIDSDDSESSSSSYSYKFIAPVKYSESTSLSSEGLEKRTLSNKTLRSYDYKDDNESVFGGVGVNDDDDDNVSLLNPDSLQLYAFNLFVHDNMWHDENLIDNKIDEEMENFEPEILV